MSERLINKIGALLGKAESTNFQHERNALISKAHKLATATTISQETARQRKAGMSKCDRPTQKDVRLLAYTDKPKPESMFVWLI